jgi:nicotinate-nucleotide adenylyltransferase
MKIGVFGGAFNPIPIGHLLTVEEVCEQLKLDKVFFVPTYDPPHKKVFVDYFHRRNMVRRAIKDNPDFELCEIEKERGGTSWTIDTLKALHTKYLKDKLYLIIGSDQYKVLNKWKQPENLKRYATLVIMKRPSIKFKVQSSKDKILVDISQIDIASNEIRKSIKSNKSFRYKIPEKVYKYIITNKLYK